MTDRQRVLELLFDRRDGFFGADELAASADVDRNGLERTVEELRHSGHEMEFAPAGGYRLVRPARLDAHLVERNLHTRRIARSVICFDEVDSTNDVAVDSARQVGTDGLVVLAESQRQGRGRQGNAWLSPPGRNVLMSVLLDANGVLRQDGLTIAAGLAVAEGIEDAFGSAATCRLKWPNDVLLPTGKVAGVLVEFRQHGRRRCAIVGIGINVNAAPPPEQVTRKAACLADYLGHPLERIDLIRAVLCRLDQWVAALADSRLDGLHDAWTARCGMINERITVLSAGRRHVGRILDVSPLEGLILSDDADKRIHLPAENTTVLD